MSGPEQKSVLGSARVLDLTDPSGVFCGKLLGALGADVIIVERPSGSPMRMLHPFHKDRIHPETSLHWFLYNMGKRSITLDVERADGQRIFKELVRTADFVVECFPPGYLHGLGLDYEELRRLNPGIIVTSVTPFGQTGPLSGYKGCDLTMQAMGGLMYQTGDEDTPPVQVSLPAAYAQSGAQAGTGSLMAYYHRLLTGEGQHVDVSVQECVMWAQKPHDVSWKAEGTIVRRGGDAPIIPGWPRLYIYFQCKDGWIAALPTYWSERPHLGEWLKDEGLADGLDGPGYDAYFAGQLSSMAIANIEETVKDRFAQMVARHDKAYLYREGQRRGVQMAPLNTVEDVMADEQLRGRDYFIRIEHPELGDTITYPGAPFKMSESPWHLDRRAPLLGEHNEAVYLGELGMSKQDLIALRELGVI